MFLLALIIGPALGLLAGDYIAKLQGGRLWGIAAVALFLIFDLLTPWFNLELRLGLFFGILLGALLAVTPLTLKYDGSFEASE